ncbi:non-classical export protein, putative [Candida dubliniensis CD36]|uniref:Non-classical export protein, putative n=1 Tax=Candida dubliniensis (strain CD36 / ATCC MYA-646 / CBS 7987 / NCPF 3949 / NRRL Y-17841) TaxID=573826 RepID=B9WHB7_CANDC|nr:non-classical export protein, putative [Candida dubliniensis CD36]CAX41559.1 non-classical export protein, putative [Candida dubliniensis CD36]
MQYPYLISKSLDPIVGVGIGVLSYYSYEQRVGRKPGHSLHELIVKKFYNGKDKN